MRLFLGENVDEFLEMSDTSASKKLQQLVITLKWLSNVHKMFSLSPRDTSDSSKLSDEPDMSINAIQQLNAIDSQPAHPSLV